MVPPRLKATPQLRISRQACDVCRLRKTKCVFDGEPSPPNGESVEAAPATSCQRCHSLQVECTFLLPVKPRGPEKGFLRKRQRMSTSMAAEPSADSPVVAPALLDASSSIPPSESAVSRQYTGPSPDSAVNAPALPSILSTGLYPPSDFHSSPDALPNHLTDQLCARSVYHSLLTDYLDYLYPSLPVVHRPTFRHNIQANQDMYDKNFLALSLAICAVVVATMPRKFREYQCCETPLRFQNRTEMVDCCHDIVMSLRGSDYFDRIGVQKWATSYLLSMAYFQLGRHNRERMLDVESMQIARLLELENPLAYAGLDCIQTQLRKRAFWLMLYIFVHSHLQSVRREKLNYLEPTEIDSLKMHELIPLEVDDEMILADSVLPQPPGKLSLATAFNAHSKSFWASITSTSPTKTQTDLFENNFAWKANHKIAYLKGRLQELKYLVDTISEPLRPWARIDAASLLVEDESQVPLLRLHFAALKTDIHITHLWLQMTLIEKIEQLEDPAQASPSTTRLVWAERESLCCQMLYILYNLEPEVLEPIGNHLTHKIRDVAVVLLSCPFDSDDSIKVRANMYIQEFVRILSRLDCSDVANTINVKAWVDADHE